MVMMCRASRRLISFTSAASVVVLPDPVGPPMSTRPRARRRQRLDLTAAGSSVANRGTVGGSRRIAAAARPRS